MKKIGFLGCGNMGGALAKAAVKSVGAENIFKPFSVTKRNNLLKTAVASFDFFSFFKKLLFTEKYVYVRIVKK